MNTFFNPPQYTMLGLREVMPEPHDKKYNALSCPHHNSSAHPQLRNIGLPCWWFCQFSQMTIFLNFQ